MSAKEKAEDLIEQFYRCMPFKDVKLTSCAESPLLIIDMEETAAKQCALISVKNILYTISGLEDSVWGLNMKSFYEEVKTELEKLQ